MKLFERYQKTPLQQAREQQCKELLHDIVRAKRDMEIAMQNFNNVPNDELADVYSYQFSAAQTKCNYLIRKAKELGVTVPQHRGSDVTAG